MTKPSGSVGLETVFICKYTKGMWLGKSYGFYLFSLQSYLICFTLQHENCVTVAYQTIISFLSESVLSYNFITRNGGQHEGKALQINLGKHESNPSDHHTAATGDEMCGCVSENWILFSCQLQNTSRKCRQLCSPRLSAWTESDGQRWRLESCHIVLRVSINSSSPSSELNWTWIGLWLQKYIAISQISKPF